MSRFPVSHFQVGMRGKTTENHLLTVRSCAERITAEEMYSYGLETWMVAGKEDE